VSTEKYLFGGESFEGTSKTDVPQGFTREHLQPPREESFFSDFFDAPKRSGGFLERPEAGEER
jgi:hypothetical protein